MERLLPAVWDDTYAYGMAAPNAPAPDMPSGTIDPKHGGTLFAHLADINAGWTGAELTRLERRSVFMHHGLDYAQVAIAAYEGVSEKTISVRLFTAIGKIVAHLNGGVFTEEYDDAA